MPLDLAGLLVEAGAAEPGALERALARQREAGGALDTALLELGIVDDDALALFLSRASGLPPPPAGALEPDPRARRVFPARVADRHGVAPFRLEGQELSLLAVHPVDLVAIDELSFMLSLRLVPHVAPEWRVRELQVRLYGGVLPERLAAVAKQARRGAFTAGARGAHAPSRAEIAHDAPPPVTPEFAVGPRAAVAPASAAGQGRADEPGTLAIAGGSWAAAPVAPAQRGPFGLSPEEPLAAALAKAGEAVGALLEPGVLDDAAAASSAEPSPRWTAEAAFAALGAARDRDEVVLVTLRYARTFFDAAALFAVSRDHVSGQDADGWPSARARCRAVHMSVEEAGLFHRAVDAAGPNLGPVPREAGNERLLASLDRPWPRTALVYPILVRDRVACVVYADNGDAPVSPGRIGDLLLVLGAVGAAFERVLREAKRSRAEAPAREQPAPAAAELPPLEPTAAEPAPPEPTAPELAPVEPAPLEPGTSRALPAEAPARAAEVEWETREPARLPTPPPEPLPDAEEDYAVAPASEALGPAEPFDAGRAVAALQATRRGSAERGRLVGRIVQHGPEAAAALRDAFPGPLDVGAAGRPAAERGPILAAMAALGRVGAPYLVALLDDPLPARRALAAELLARAGDASALLPLAERALDPDPGAAAAALSALVALRGHPEFQPVLDRLRRAVLGGDADRPALAAWALARLGDAEAVPLLVEGLAAPPPLGPAAREALEALTARRLGADGQAWIAWWRAHRAEGRAEWLFSALTDEDAAVRAGAAERLREAAPSPVGYSPDLPAPQRAQAARAWREWWARHGSGIRP